MIVKWYQVTAILADLGDLLTLGRDDRAREVCIHSIQYPRKQSCMNAFRFITMADLLYNKHYHDSYTSSRLITCPLCEWTIRFPLTLETNLESFFTPE